MATYAKRSGAWRAQIRRKGYPSESATFTKLTDAKAWAEERERELNLLQHGRIIPRSMKQALEEYSLRVAPTHRGARWEQVRCKKLARELPFRDRLLTEVRPADVVQWRDEALEQLAPASVRREMGLLRLVFEAARLEWGWCRANPVDDVKRPRNPPARKRLFADAEVEELLAAAGYERGAVPSTAAQRAAVALLIALETGMRAGELCGVRPERDIDVDGRVLRLQRTKNDDERRVPLSKVALALWALLPDGLGLSAKALDVHFRALRDGCGFDDLHFHDSRATAVTRLSKKLDILELARMIGHRDLRSLQVYYRKAEREIAERLD